MARNLVGETALSPWLKVWLAFNVAIGILMAWWLFAAIYWPVDFESKPYPEGLHISEEGQYISTLAMFALLINMVAGLAYLLWPTVPVLTLRGPQGESGELALPAVRELLLHELGNQRDVREPRLSLCLPGPQDSEPKLTCRVEFVLTKQPDIPGRVDALREMIREVYDRAVPGSLPIDVTCYVRDIRGDRPSGSSGVGFAGPIYPVGGSDESGSEG